MAEPVLAEVVRPAADALAKHQEQADLQRYNERHDSYRQMAGRLEQLDPRGDLPDVPTLEPGGDPDVWRHPGTLIDNPEIPDEVEATAPVVEVDGELQEMDAEFLGREESVEWHQTDIFQPDPE